MNALLTMVAATVFGISIAGSAATADNGVEGEKLYTSQCKVCHGMNADEAANSRRAVRAVHLAWGASTTQTRTDAPPLLAFAPPFGPNLRGIYMRPAGTQKDFQYSAAFINALRGMPWSEAALDVWITNTQAWVPGAFMFYKQKDPEIRRKIIEYLKANP